MARPGFPVFSSVGSYSSHGSFHPIGPRRLPSQSVASTHRSMRFHQRRCCSVSAPERACWLLSGYTARKGREVAAANVVSGNRPELVESNTELACACASQLHLGLPSTDQGQAPSSPIDKPRDHSTSKARWWFPASTQSPQKVILNRQVAVADLNLVG